MAILPDVTAQLTDEIKEEKDIEKQLVLQNKEQEMRAAELIAANKELAFQNSEKGKRAAELSIANIELIYQNKEKEQRAAELIIANKELAFQNGEKEKRAAELIIANHELVYQNAEKEKRAAELMIANKELAFQNTEKGKRAAELIIANKELVYQNGEKEKRAAELIIANEELAFQNGEKEERAAELIIANNELIYQNKEKEKRAAELIIANKELAFQNREKEKRAAELIIANEELAFQNGEKEERAAELIIANNELIYQNKEKEKRAAELIIANKELAFQNREKEKRAAELRAANGELAFQNGEKEKRTEELIVANRLYVFISAINQTIVHSENEQTVFRRACRIAIDIGKFELAIIMAPDKINRKINIVEHCNARADDLEFFSTMGFEEGSPAAEVFRSGKLRTINDYENEPSSNSTKKFATERGFKSCILLPIMKSGKTMGVYSLYSISANSFDLTEIALLEEAAGDISFALDVFEKEKERKKMEDKITHNELRLKQAQAIAHFGSWELDLSTGMAEWSEEACRIYGLAPEDNKQTYQSWASYIHPDDVDYVMRETKESERSLSNIGFYHRIIRKDGAIRHIYSQSQFEISKEGKLTGVNHVEHDITEMKEAEAERTKLLADVVQRNKDLEQFSYIVSHNLRAPIANILGIVNLLQTAGIDKDEEEKATDFLGTATQNLDNVIRDLNQILEVRNKVNGAKENIKFEKLLNEIKLSIEEVIKKERVHIICDFSEAEGMTGLKSYLYSIFSNLISNSIKYRRPVVEPIIEITSTRIKDGIRIIFKDNGLGIDLKNRGNEVFGLYKRFHQHVEGKGVGLYMVKIQVEALGGTIAIASELNNGTEFRMEFGDIFPPKE